MRTRVGIALLGILLCAAGRASASPILLAATPSPAGTFEWTYDVLFGTGSTFTVTNESANPFDDVFVDLYATGFVDPFQSVALGTIAAGGISQSTDDLSALTVPGDLDRAHLRFLLDSQLVGLDLYASQLQGDPGSVLAASIDIPGSGSPAPVPEPATLLLLASGAGALGVRRFRHMRRN